MNKDISLLNSFALICQLVIFRFSAIPMLAGFQAFILLEAPEGTRMAWFELQNAFTSWVIAYP